MVTQIRNRFDIRVLPVGDLDDFLKVSPGCGCESRGASRKRSGSATPLGAKSPKGLPTNVIRPAARHLNIGMKQIIDVIDNRLDKIPLTRDEKDFCLRVVDFEKFRQISIWIDAGGYFGIAICNEEPASGEWFFFWVQPLVKTDQNGNRDIHYTYNAQYKLRPDGELILT
jgi:hypothetical protein